MNKILITLVFFLVSFSSFAQSRRFCERGQVDIQTKLHDASSRMAFKNSGGLFNGGVCWWHSRFQRAAAYLIEFEPSKLPPTRQEALKIINHLRAMNAVVKIPGYQDFETFSKDYQREIQSVLNKWQRSDGFYNFEWLRGISGRSQLPASELQTKMKKLFESFQNSPNPIWIMAQIKGITSHSFLVLDMNQRDDGFDLVLIDSNRPDKNSSVSYFFGDTSLKPVGSNYTFIPYLGFQGDFQKILGAIKASCGNSKLIGTEILEMGDIE